MSNGGVSILCIHLLRHIIRVFCRVRCILLTSCVLAVVMLVTKLCIDGPFSLSTKHGLDFHQPKYKNHPERATPNSSQETDAGEYWGTVKDSVTRESLYGPYFNWRDVTNRLASARIERAWLFSPDEKSYEDIPQDLGSTHKWFLQLEGGQQAIFKPFW